MNKQKLTEAVNAGLSFNEMAYRFCVSASTIRYWTKVYGLKTKRAERRSNSCSADGQRQQFCDLCKIALNEVNSYKKHKNGTRSNFCKKCQSIVTRVKRAETKKKCIDYKGGKCKNCGYIGFHEAFEFHHMDEGEKEKEVAKMLNCNWEKIVKELEKCDLLCSNCHRKEHCKLDRKNQLSREFQLNTISNFYTNIYTGQNTSKESCKFCDKVLTEANRGSGTHRHMCKSCDSKHVIQKGVEGKKRAVKLLGGACRECGYSACCSALEVLYKDRSAMPETFRKRYKYWGPARQEKELKNCIMICARCSRGGE
jgi:DNA-binding transcriptional MerR regulator